MATVKVSSKNQIALPAAARRKLGIRPGDRLRVEIQEHRLVIEPEEDDPAAVWASIAPEAWRGIDTDKYLDDLRNEWSHREF